MDRRDARASFLRLCGQKPAVPFARQRSVQLIKTMIERMEERFEIKPAYLAADTAYGSADTLNWMVNEKKIAPHIPVIDKSSREDGTFSREDFSFDLERNIYICPAVVRVDLPHQRRPNRRQPNLLV